MLVPHSTPRRLLFDGMILFYFQTSTASSMEGGEVIRPATKGVQNVCTHAAVSLLTPPPTHTRGLFLGDGLMSKENWGESS